MKKKLSIPGILFICVLLLTSCEKEKPLSEAIIGKWEVISMTQITYESNVKKAEIILYFEADEMAYQFIEGGSGIYSEGTDEGLFSWSLNGSEITISNLYTEDFVVNAAIDSDILSWSYEDIDPQDPKKTYEYIMNAKRIN
jgi:uncharacterized lipoprotein YehR (DUF1307 family)